MDRKIQRALLMTELDEFNKRFEVAERYDNAGDKEFYRTLINETKTKIYDLELCS